MGENRAVYWEQQAEHHLNKIIDYLLKEWYWQVAKKFYEQVFATVDTLVEQPYLGRPIRGTTESFSFPVGYYRLVYFFDEKRIVITDIVDMRSEQAIKNE